MYVFEMMGWATVLENYVDTGFPEYRISLLIHLFTVVYVLKKSNEEIRKQTNTTCVFMDRNVVKVNKHAIKSMGNRINNIHLRYGPSGNS